MDIEWTNPNIALTKCKFQLEYVPILNVYSYLEYIHISKFQTRLHVVVRSLPEMITL